MLYAGPQRRLERARVRGADIVVVSYEVLRNEIDFFEPIRFSYCILDEGHVIKVRGGAGCARGAR